MACWRGFLRTVQAGNCWYLLVTGTSPFQEINCKPMHITIFVHLANLASYQTLTLNTHALRILRLSTSLHKHVLHKLVFEANNLLSNGAGSMMLQGIRILDSERTQRLKCRHTIKCIYLEPSRLVFGACNPWNHLTSISGFQLSTYSILSKNTSDRVVLESALWNHGEKPPSWGSKLVQMW